MLKLQLLKLLCFLLLGLIIFHLWPSKYEKYLPTTALTLSLLPFFVRVCGVFLHTKVLVPFILFSFEETFFVVFLLFVILFFVFLCIVYCWSQIHPYKRISYKWILVRSFLKGLLIFQISLILACYFVL